MSTTAVRTNDAHRPRARRKSRHEARSGHHPCLGCEAREGQFYEGLGWRLDADFTSGDEHVVQVTPPGSQCSVHFGTNLTSAAAGSTQGGS